MEKSNSCLPINHYHASLVLLHGIPEGCLLQHPVRSTVIKESRERGRLALVPVRDQPPLHRLKDPLSSFLARLRNVGVEGRQENRTTRRKMVVKRGFRILRWQVTCASYSLVGLGTHVVGRVIFLRGAGYPGWLHRLFGPPSAVRTGMAYLMGITSAGREGD